MNLRLPGPVPKACSRCGALIQPGQACRILLEGVRTSDRTLEIENLEVECPICSLLRSGEERKRQRG